MRQNRLAQSLGMDESILSKIVNGFREPSQELRERIAYLLQMDEDWLFQRLDPSGVPAKNGADTESSAPSLHAKRSTEGI